MNHTYDEPSEESTGEPKSETTSSTEKPKQFYTGNFRAKTRKTGAKFLSGSICLESIREIPEEHITRGSNGKHYVKIIIEKRLEPDKYGNTHTMKVDTFKPDFYHNVPKENTEDDGVM